MRLIFFIDVIVIALFYFKKIKKVEKAELIGKLMPVASVTILVYGAFSAVAAGINAMNSTGTSSLVAKTTLGLLFIIIANLGAAAMGLLTGIGVFAIYSIGVFGMWVAYSYAKKKELKFTNKLFNIFKGTLEGRVNHGQEQ